MKKFGFLLFFAAMACAFTSCRKTVELSFGVDSVTFAPEGETREVELKSTGDWTVNDVPEWLSVSPMSGNGDVRLTLVAQPNATGVSRNGEVKASTKDVDATLKVSQNALPDDPGPDDPDNPDDPDDPDDPDNPDPDPQHYLEVAPDALQFVCTGESKQLTLTCDEVWEVVASEEWVSLDKTEGEGDDVVTVTVEENPLYVTRHAMMRFESVSSITVRVEIIQEASPDPHFLEVTPTSLLFGNEGGSQEVAVGCDTGWHIEGLEEWLTASTEGGTGNGSVTFTATPNVFAEVRAATVSFISDNLTTRVSVMQDPGEEQYWASVSPDSLFIGQAGGVRSFTITSNTSWTVSFPSWITYFVSSGTGEATLDFVADANMTLSQRIGYIHVMRNGGVLTSLVVVQEGIESILVPDVIEIEMPAEGGSYTLHLTANQSWTISTGVAWFSCTPNEGNGDADVLVKAIPLGTAPPREAVLVIIGSLGTEVEVTVRQSPDY